MKRWIGLFITTLLAIGAFGPLCGCDPQGLRLPKADAAAVLIPTQGQMISGVATFIEVAGGVRVMVDITGLSPGPYGIHIHEFGDCRSHDGSSAGRHFNPGNQPHGEPGGQNRHAGDLGNIVADTSGNASLDIVNPMITLQGANGIIGRSVVVHAGEDDLSTQPSGASGERLACGPIGFARR